jgi:hypothetical protein
MSGTTWDNAHGPADADIIERLQQSQNPSGAHEEISLRFFSYTDTNSLDGNKGRQQRDSASTSQPFNPYVLHAIRIPLDMLSYPRLSWPAKCLYGRLALHLGKPRPGARCNPNLCTLATEMGASVDSVDRWLKELISEGFIERRRHRRQAAECVFLPHPCLVDSAELRSQGACRDSADSRSQEAVLDSVDSWPRFRTSAVKIPQICGQDSANSTQKFPQRADSISSCASENVQENVQENIQEKQIDAEPSSVPLRRRTASNDRGCCSCGPRLR